jgi:type III secretory pathway component EscS
MFALPDASDAFPVIVSVYQILQKFQDKTFDMYIRVLCKAVKFFRVLATELQSVMICCEM